MKNNYASFTLRVKNLLYLWGCLACFSFSGKLWGQAQQRVEGTVTGKNGPVFGANVTLKGQHKGTVTNAKGHYQLTVQPNDTLTFSYIGYQTVEKPVEGKSPLDVQLKQSENSLGDVVINAGYYKTTARERTGDIAKVTANEIENQPIISPLEALQGRMAGVEVVQKTGIPGAAPTIRIRGQSSLRNSLDDNGNLPLYIIDGVPVNSNPLHSFNSFSQSTGVGPLNTLNLSNIKSIEVLKDADATAIYGSRGANGVILITTKIGEGAQAKTKLEARFYSGISRVSHFVDLLDTRQYLALRREAFKNDAVVPTEANAKDLLLWDQDRETDWQKKLFGRTAFLTNMNFTISGGNETTSFRLGGSYHKQGTVFPGDYAYDKKTVNLSLNHRSKDQKFRLDLTANYGLDYNDLFNSSNFVSNSFRLSPNAPAVYNEDGSLNWENSTWTNPLAILNSDGQAKVNNLVSSLGLRYELVKGLQLKVNLGYTSLDSEEKIKQPVEIYDPALWDRISPRSIHGSTKRKSWIAEPQLAYSLNIGKHHLNALAGATFQQSENTSLQLIGTGYSDRHLIGNLSAADAVAVTENKTITYKYNAVFARIGYNLARTYFLNLTGRRDGSSRFGPGKRFANFGAVGTAWIFSRETWMKKHFDFLSFGKLRGSYGITGNDQIGDYRYLDAYEATPGPGGLYPTQLTNPDFSWETNKKLEAAMELGFLKDRINLNLSWYRNRSSNQLVGYPLSAMTGFTTVEANLPATVQNTGWELEFSSLNLKTANFRWRSSFNLTIPENKLINFSNIEATSYKNIYRVGEPLSLAILYKYEGIDPETGRYRVKDVNGDGSYDYEDRIVTKNLGRQYYGGLNNQFTYKNFSVGFLVEFVKQKGRKIPDARPGSFGNTLQGNFKVWRANRTGTNIQKASQAISSLFSYNRAKSSGFGVTDASYVRLKTLSIGYALPQGSLKSIGLSSCKLFFHAQNLFTLTGYVGLDPQNPGSIVLPALQSFTGGVQFNF